MATVKVDKFISDFAAELAEQNVAIFAGAGLSVPAGFVDWKGLLRPLAVELGLDVEREHDLVRLAQYNVNHHGSNRNDLTQAILNGFSQREAQITENHRILARLPIATYWTTNYDACIETALSESGKRPDVKHAPSQLLQTLHGRDAIVYKMHGDYQDAAHAVLCKEDFERYHVDRADFLTALAGDLLSKTFLFIGLSFSDPNLDYVLGRMYTRHGHNQRKHYCFVRKESAHKDDRPGDLEYRLAKQDLFIRDLSRYNIRAVLVYEYNEITEILRAIEARHKSRTVFVSGAAHDYGSRFSAADALSFVHRLSSVLIEHDFRIVTGLGVGIGSTVVDGALNQIYHVQRRRLTDQLVFRPFPQSPTGKALWTAYRNDMLDFAGLALFMFGNKFEGSPPSVVNSNGMVEEFDIAHSKGVRVLPLGFTEFVSRELYERVKGAFGRYYPNSMPTFKQHFDLLGDPSRALDEQLRTTIDALLELRKM